MKAMILAAGRGERMRPLTDHCPKPLLRAGEKRLIEYPLERLQIAGYDEVIINTHYLGEKIHQALGDGSRYGLPIRYSDEYPEVLETGGGICRALPLLGDEPFLVVNGDVWCDHPLTAPVLAENALAHLVLVPNPEHNPAGDFALDNGGGVNSEGSTKYTFSGIGWYRPELFADCPSGAFPLAPLLREAMEKGQVTGELYEGIWMDVGTPERLEAISKSLQNVGAKQG